MKFENYMVLEFPSKSCNEAFARAAVGAFIAPMDPNLEELSDIENKKHSFTIEKVDGVYVVDAEFLAPILSTVNMEDYESLQYFQRVLRYSGIIDELERMGIQEDDLVSIYDFEFNYVR